MIPLTFLYDEYIDRPKFTEQKKNPFEYIVPSPTSGVGTKKHLIFAVTNLAQFACGDTVSSACIAYAKTCDGYNDCGPTANYRDEFNCKSSFYFYIEIYI